MIRFGIALGTALVLAGCQSTGTAPPSGYFFESDKAGLVSSTTEIDPVTGMTVTTSTAWEQGPEPVAKRQPSALAGRWMLTDGKFAKCGFDLTTEVSRSSKNFLVAKRVGPCPLEYTYFVDWVLLDHEMILMTSLGRILAVLTEQPDGRFIGNFSTDAGPVPVTLRRAEA
jgi:hypothetical protein